LINREKGIANLEVSAQIPDGDFMLLDISGGERPNIVIDRCTAEVRVGSAARAQIETEIGDSWDKNLAFHWKGDVLRIEAVGKAAHGSQPFRGDSAAIRLLRFLREAAPIDVEPFYGDLFDSSHPGGAGLGISGSDEPSRDLTSNLGIISVKAGAVKLLFNVRYPVTWTGGRLRELCEKYLAQLASKFELEVLRDSPPLFFPLDHPLVRTICDVYEEETGEHREPGSMGGGTYARAVPNTVSIGTGWWGDGKAHEADELLKVEHLFKMSRIYAHILYRLATV
jgi:succinyl-diaminopimelate desuccinylase